MPVHHADVGNLIKDTDKAIPEAVGKMFGVRIPSQDNHSTVNIRMVDFMDKVMIKTLMVLQGL